MEYPNEYLESQVYQPRTHKNLAEIRILSDIHADKTRPEEIHDNPALVSAVENGVSIAVFISTRSNGGNITWHR